MSFAIDEDDDRVNQLVLPCLDPEGCEHFKEMVKLRAKNKRLKETCRRIKVITDMADNSDSAAELQSDLKIIGRVAALEGAD